MKEYCHACTGTGQIAIPGTIISPGVRDLVYRTAECDVCHGTGVVPAVESGRQVQENLYADMRELLHVTLEERDAAREEAEQVRALLDELLEYSEHARTCAIYRDQLDACSCGLTEVVKAVDTARRADTTTDARATT